MATTIPLSEIPRRLKAKHGNTISYRAAYNAVVDGRIPATRGDNGRWPKSIFPPSPRPSA